MFMHKSKKGFTIVELVIVIAVIAILAAVLIPTFSNLVKKANRSADQQAVRQMNTLLAAEEATGKPETFANAINALLASNVSMKNYKALVADMSFYWVKELNRVVYVDKNMTVTYPADLTETTYKMEDGWFSLSGEVATDANWANKITNTTTITVDNGATMVAFMNAVAAGDITAKAVTTVNITEDIDLKGAEANFGQFTGSINIVGTQKEGKNPTIYNLRNGASTVVTTNNDNNNATSYGFGLFAWIGNEYASGNKTANVTIENVTFENVAINGTPASGSESASSAGVIAGTVRKGSSLTVTNVEIRDSYVNVVKKAGAAVGYVTKDATLTISGLTVENVQVAAGKQSAALVGYAQSAITGSNITVTNVTVSKDTSYSADAVGSVFNGEYATNNHYWDATNEPNVVAKNFN